jgi:hypothetical protein
MHSSPRQQNQWLGGGLVLYGFDEAVLTRRAKQGHDVIIATAG